MKDTLKQGLTTTRRVDVDRARTIDFMGEDGRVYSTPALIEDIEVTCRNLALEHLDPGEDTVGTRVELDHMAATLEGMWVDITATITALDGRAVTFNIAVRDAVDDVARGIHNRFVVDVEKTKARLAAKAAKAKTA